MNAPTNFDLDALKADLSAKSRELFIGGKYVPAASGETIDVVNPATGQSFATAAAGGEEDINRAVAAARKAFDGGWPQTSPAQRARLMLKLADLIEANADELAFTETLDNGMPLMMAKMGAVGAAAEQLRYNAGWATKITGETITPSFPGEWQCMTLRQPVGVVGAIVPWNFPFAMAVSKLAAALAAGCTIVLKPAEQTPLTAALLGRLIGEAGFPEGVVNIVTGYGHSAGAALAAHPDVNKVSFTGSTAIGKEIIRASTGNLKRVTLELGGKSPTVIFGDADLSKAIPSAAMGIFGNSGQVCAAGSRLFAHESVFEQVVEGISAMAQNLKVGSGLSPETQMGPLVSDKQQERVLSYIESGGSEGASVAVGGGTVTPEGCEGGYFVQPTVLTGTVSGMKVVEEEIFGPVLCAMRFGDDDIDMIAKSANASDYGLSSSIWTENITSALKLARRLEAGNVRINGVGGGVDPALPLGGFKQSGWGRECGRAGVEAYTELKTVSIGLG
ncbi:aldehyde dehydrogenase family protein [Altericroceibacterium endophyticum]|uniref:Aldehyde dehydrogenase family protein n=1 Tax=Altericroceibacterium endophyticum TaxID=1808508 RepID=A0A6I4T521_9SPHN|nr:aldehyde dehydrogenase family protein [Altericroceibacterium endophyticum]MXO65153.1 aldehyde dehydrogenase family protein [Altericroceibacterium endophyticum]